MLTPVLLPLAGGTIALIVSIVHWRRVAWAVVLTAIFAAAVVMGLNAAQASAHALSSAPGTVIQVAGGWSERAGIVIVMDTAGVVLGPVVLIVAFLILLTAAGQRQFGSVFAGVAAITVAAMTGVILSGDLFNLFVFFEALSLGAVILIAWERRGPALYAALRYLVVGTVSIAFYLIGLLLVYRSTGELAIHRIIPILAGSEVTRGTTVGLGCMLAAVATRGAILPFHGWLPAAHGEAPAPVSALLSGLMLKSALVALWRISTIVRVAAPQLLETLLVLGALSAVAGAFAAALESDAKRVLAFSSISQMGYLVTALAVGAREAMLYHAVGHALFKSTLFLVIGAAVSRAGSHQLSEIGRVNRRDGYPWIEGPVLLIGALAVAGAPGFSGFAGKQLIGAALYSSPAAYLALRIAALGTVTATMRLLLVYGNGRPRFSGAPMTTTAALAALAAAILWHGGQHLHLVSPAATVEFLIILGVAAAMVALSRIPRFWQFVTTPGRIRPGMDAVIVSVLAGIILLIR